MNRQARWCLVHPPGKCVPPLSSVREGRALTIVGTNPDAVIGGVDTHADVHVAAAVNHVGGVLDGEAFGTTRAGYRELVSWLRSTSSPAKHGLLQATSVGRSSCTTPGFPPSTDSSPMLRTAPGLSRWAAESLLVPPSAGRPPANAGRGPGPVLGSPCRSRVSGPLPLPTRSLA